MLLPLTDGSVFSIDAITIKVNLSTVDANALKAHTFATSDSDTYLTVAAGTIFDLSCNSSSHPWNSDECLHFRHDST